MSLKGKLFIRENLLENNNALKHILENALSKVEIGSKFEKKNKDYLSDMKDNPLQLINFLSSQGYDIMLGYKNENLIGHMAFQEHTDTKGKNWEMFHLYVNPEERNKNYSVELSFEFIKKAIENKTNSIKLGEGGHPITEKVIKRIQEKYGKELKIQDHWIYLR